MGGGEWWAVLNAEVGMSIAEVGMSIAEVLISYGVR